VKCVRLAIFAAFVCLWLTRTGSAQGGTGSTTLDIDAISGVVTATCETDLDVDAQAYYEAEVECKLKDSNGKELSAGRYLDKGGAQGYAQVVLTIDGVPGTTYTADGSHLLEIIFIRSTEPSLGQPSRYTDYDPFSFGELDKLHETYRNMYEWFGTGLGTQGQK
jgi:hypothetical protein